MKIALKATAEMDDGRTLSVVLDQREYASAEAAEATIAGMSGSHTRARYMVFHALKRTDQYKGTWAQFNGRDCIEVETFPEDADGDDDGLDPGRKDPSAAS